jgi:hypothetical protein
MVTEVKIDGLLENFPVKISNGIENAPSKT